MKKSLGPRDSRRFPGWKMTVAQHGQWLRLWLAACKAQGWDKLSTAEREAKRDEVYIAAFGYRISTRDISSGDGCDRIFAAFRRLAYEIPAPDQDQASRRPHVKHYGSSRTRHTHDAETHSSDDAYLAARRRLLHQAALRIDAWIDLAGAPYVESILKPRFKLIRGWLSINDLSNEDLINLLRTVNSRIAQPGQTQIVCDVPPSDPEPALSTNEPS